MENALYGPGGYYSENKADSGQSGDYFTAVDTGPAFGLLLSSLFQSWSQRTDLRPFAVVEAGAGTGRLAKVMAGQQDPAHRFSGYTAVELSYARREAMRSDPALKNVSIVSRLSAIPPFRGVLFANELIDALPAHRVRMHAGQLQEAYVAPSLDRFEWGDPSTPALARYLERAGIVLEDNQTVEINLAMRHWLEEAFAVMQSGFLVLIDYGSASVSHFHPDKVGGTLRRFHHHRVSSQLLQEEGASDLTADVDFTGLALDAQEIGFDPLAFYSLSSFLTLAEVPAGLNTEESRRGLKLLLHPEGLGGQFQVLVLTKGLPENVRELFPHNRIASLDLQRRSSHA